MNSRKTIRPVRNTLRAKKNVMRGRGVVVLDRLNAKEAIYEDENHRKFQNAETAGGSLVIAKTNRIGERQDLKTQICIIDLLQSVHLELC